MKMEVLVHPQLGLRFGAALPGGFFSQKNSLLIKIMFFCNFQMIFHQNEPNLLLTRGTTIRTGILTPVELVGTLNP